MRQKAQYLLILLVSCKYTKFFWTYDYFSLFLQKNNDMAENEWFEKAWECMDNEDYAQAKKYFERAAKEGVAEAYCDLGNLYFAGNGVAQDYKQAFEMYLKGAKAGEVYRRASVPGRA